MAMAAAQHGMLNGLFGYGVKQNTASLDGAALYQQAAAQQAAMTQDALSLSNVAAAQQMRCFYLQSPAHVLSEAKNRAGETFPQWQRRCSARQLLAEVSGYPISDIELSVIDAERYEWEQINGK